MWEIPTCTLTSVQKFRMYYSASSLHLPDSNIDEPLHLGLAESDSILGDWTRVTNEPLQLNVNPDPTTLDVVGVGSLKLVDGHEDDSIALMNQITRRRSDNATGSTISLVKINGLEIEPLTAPLIPPTLKSGSWKESYVYGFDTLRVDENTTVSAVMMEARGETLVCPDFTNCFWIVFYLCVY